MKNWHILVVEDDPDGQELVERIFEHYHIPCEAVRTAEEALERAKSTSYTAFLIDLELPQMDGWGLLHKLQQMNLNTPCVAITAYHSAEVAYKAREAGFVGYFAKPLEAPTFLSTLKSYLESA